MTKFTMEIRNLELSEVNYPEIYLFREGTYQNLSPAVVDFEKINPTSYKISLKKSSNIPEVLVFSELYNSSWKGPGEHILANKYANGWIIKNPGEYSFFLTFAPQKVFDISKQVSLISIILGSLFVVYKFIRK